MKKPSETSDKELRDELKNQYDFDSGPLTASTRAVLERKLIKLRARDEDDPEKFTPDASRFKRPDIALPKLVEAKTNEKNEDVLFNARCRLDRFSPEVGAKECGTVELKVLKHKQTGKMRCVMRREQVSKLCANFPVTSKFEVLATKQGENVLTWACMDFSEQTDGELTTFICRFKNVNTAQKFKQIVQLDE